MYPDKLLFNPRGTDGHGDHPAKNSSRVHMKSTSASELMPCVRIQLNIYCSF